ncbi:acyltransferase [Kibdelosporangium philippinense]|uniref:Acyltransferase n=1 Tax=Kibdelosporangium philippinense TaxID=211113 RepID=A0ABS8ZT85_9PSEU|nr:acyltransferase family protein [Kibdelosporangium philippinense]MCE7010892.1 acyltransferase [Kibdelosporangium philippinense]
MTIEQCTVRLPRTEPTVKFSRPTRFPALDGLRCLAVVAVILSHANVPWARGGFIGVDVFFVLSGYLITGQLWAQVASGRVNLKRFWAARVRRLAPALLVVLVTASLAVLIAARDQLGSFRGDLVAALAYASNWWYVLGQRSYFESSGRPPVLQHLWSLAVEEQFYLVWPLMLALFAAAAVTWRRRRTAVLTLIIGLALASALTMAIGSAMDNVPYDNDGSRWYFGTDSHAFGLLLGAGLAVFRHGDGLGRPMAGLRKGPPWLASLGATALLALVAATIWLDPYTEGLYRYGLQGISLAALAVTAAATRQTPVARLLSLGPLRAVGRRSYGLYLWHWPVMTFTRPNLDVDLDGPGLFLLRLTLIAALTEMSYQMVEKPVREKGWTRWRIGPVPGIAVLAAVVVAIVVTVFALSGNKSGTTANVIPSAATPSATATDAKQLSISAYGDSVLEGAIPGMQKAFKQADVSTTEGIQASKVLEKITADQESGKLQPIVLIHTGDNGVIKESQLTGVLDKLRDRQRVLLATVYVARPWQDDNLKLLRSMPDRYSNLRIVDWNAFASEHKDLLYNDGIHMKPQGATAYANLIAQAATAP